MADSIPVDKLALMLGVDSNAMIAGFTSAAASSRAMARALMEAMNREFEKGNQESARQFEMMLHAMGPLQDAQVQSNKKYVSEIQKQEQQIMAELVAEQKIWQELYAERDNLRNREIAIVRMQAAARKKIAEDAEAQEREILERSTKLREDMIQRSLEAERRANEQRISDLRAAIQNRAILERSASNIMITGMSSVGRVDPMAAAMGAAYRAQQQAAQEAAAAAREAQDAELERARIAIVNANAADEQERAARRLSVARRLQAKADEDAARILAVENRRIEENNALNEEAARILRMIQTPEEAHKARVERLNALYAIGKLNKEQYNLAVKQSEGVMKASAAGMGKMTGVLAQLSFGIEDFVQGIAMGDLRSALLGASNNISMVVRGLVDMSAETKIAGMAVGKFVGVVAAAVAATGGLAYYLNWLSQAKRDTRSLTDAIRDATMGFDLLGTASKNQTRIERERMSIKRITSIEEINRREQEHMLDQIDNEKELMRIRNESSVKAAEIITSMMGGAEARVDVEKMLSQMAESNNVAMQKSAIEMQKSLSNAQQAMAKGDAETAIREMRRVFEFLNSESTRAFAKMFMFGGASGEDFRSIFFDRTALNALEEYFEKFTFLAGESDEKLRQLREEALKTKKDLTQAEAEQNRLKAQAIDMELRRRELEAERARMMEQEFLLSQKQAEAQQREVLFLITATERQKELLRLKKETDAFGGAAEANVPGAMGLGGIAGGIGGMMADMAIDMAAEDRRIQFLEAQRQQLQVELNKLMQQDVKPQGALEQNAFQAQADAFKQIMENANKQPNPQVTRIINLITSIDAALKNGGVIKVVP